MLKCCLFQWIFSLAGRLYLWRKTFCLSKCDFCRLFHTERSWHAFSAVFVISPIKSIPFHSSSFHRICGQLWGSLAVEDHLRSRDHLWLGIICGTVQDSWKKKKLEILQKVREILFFPDQDLGRGGDKYLLKYYLVLCMVQFYLLPSSLGQV